MKKKIYYSIIIFIFLFILGIIFNQRFAINKTPDISKINIKLSLNRIDNEIIKVINSNKNIKLNLAKILDRNPKFKRYFLGIYNNERQIKVIDELIRIFKNPYQKKIFKESKLIFGDFEILKKQIEKAFKYLKFYYPNFVIPEIIIFSTGLTNDIYIHKDLIVIDLSYFYGKNSKYTPTMPEYLLNIYTPNSIIPKMILLLSKNFNEYDFDDSSLLSDMIYYGKAYVFTKYILPKISFKDMFGYNDDQIKYLKKNKSLIWEYFINHQLIYNKSKETKSQFIDEAPFTFEFGKKSPSKIGRWIGKNIVENFMKNNKKITLKDLMNIKDSQFIFSNSKYTSN